MFATELELVTQLLTNLPDLFPRASQRETEVGSRDGIADVVVARAEPQLFGARMECQLQPVGLPGALQLLAVMAEEPSDAESLFVRAALHPGYGRRLLRQLASTGHVTHGEDGLWHRASAVRDAYSVIVAIEAKLEEWRRALGQAMRYVGYADFAFVALPANRAAIIETSGFANTGVGLIAVGSMSSRIVVDARNAGQIQPWRRLLVSEQLVAAASDRTPDAKSPDWAFGSRPTARFRFGQSLPAH